LDSEERQKEEGKRRKSRDEVRNQDLGSTVFGDEIAVPATVKVLSFAMCLLPFALTTVLHCLG
jgi:hypothetical protein